jgi:hypothetical protein
MLRTAFGVTIWLDDPEVVEVMLNLDGRPLGRLVGRRPFRWQRKN